MLACPVPMDCPLNQKSPMSKAISPCLASWSTAARVFGQKNADNTDSAGKAYEIHKIIHGEIGYLVAVWFVTLIAYAFTTSVGALSAVLG